MIRRPPNSTRTDTLFPYTTLFRSLTVSPTEGREEWTISGTIADMVDGAAIEVALMPVNGRWWSVDLSLGGITRTEIASLDPTRRLRSEEHTSELQSLMRISYAVFCLKKKKKNIEQQHRT